MSDECWLLCSQTRISIEFPHQQKTKNSPAATRPSASQTLTAKCEWITSACIRGGRWRCRPDLGREGVCRAWVEGSEDGRGGYDGGEGRGVSVKMRVGCTDRDQSDRVDLTGGRAACSFLHCGSPAWDGRGPSLPRSSPTVLGNWPD